MEFTQICLCRYSSIELYKASIGIGAPGPGNRLLPSSLSTDRCCDPTEFGTYLSAVSCSDCGGRLLPARPLDADADWACDRCARSEPAKTASDLHARLTAEIKALGREGDGIDP